jgi:uncharacterized protein with HEPN domain
MKSSDIQRIHHIKTYCEDIVETIGRFGREYDAFIRDKDYFKSVSMSMMQIGELSAGLSDEFKIETQDQMQWGAMKGMRNLFAHAYISMNKEIIWESANRDIFGLLKFCERILSQAQTPSYGRAMLWGRQGVVYCLHPSSYPFTYCCIARKLL